ncbi:hypothetical protein FOL47_010086 [Perkinsus chesapeaki]|uniref:Sfi1 spindle body domain-containing protein n=1 Tax=Perkinsus chesapeaki TaxID=330153 RepID=A0A7J6L4X0_PERCH|nr:hypothetical protein FOL47_010086 [Perkinsus chesapeaki]
MQTNTVPLPTPPEVLRMYERAERLKCSKITRELRRTEQERMTRTDKEALRSNTEWRKRDHLKELKLRRRVIEQNRLLVMETLQRAERIWNRRVLGKCFAYFTDTLEERRFRELKAERWYLTVVRLKSIKAFTLWLESCRKLRLKAAELYQEKLARRALIWMRIGSAQSREGRIKCYTAKIQQGRCIRLLRVWSSVAAESLKEKYTKSDDIANRTVKRKVFSAWIMLPSIEGFEREVDTRKAELWNKVHRMMGYQAHQPANYDLVS